jgi:REP element-mobilizing transposase RayT
MSAQNPRFHRRSIRLPEYDYSQEGVYYITICTQGRKCLFGDIADGTVELSKYGRIAERCWRELTEYYDGIMLDAYVIMPNHIHAIIIITGDVTRRGEVVSPQYEMLKDNIVQGDVVLPQNGINNNIINPGEVTSPLQVLGNKHTLGKILEYYKYQTTKIINQIHNSPVNKIWQRNYYERVIRNEKSLNRIRGYIRNNPWNWAVDDENPERKITLRRVRAIYELPRQ